MFVWRHLFWVSGLRSEVLGVAVCGALGFGLRVSRFRVEGLWFGGWGLEGDFIAEQLLDDSEGRGCARSCFEIARRLSRGLSVRLG